MGAVLLGIALSLQSIVSGIEITQFALARSGALSLPTLDSTLESSQNLGLPGMFLLPLWFVTPTLGIVVMMIALWRSRTVSRVAIVLVLASQVLELVGIPLPGDWLLSFVGMTWMAFAVLTLGAMDRR